MKKAEKQLRLAYRHHAVESLVPGYFVCQCGCGYHGVCRHCVPHASRELPWMLCETARRAVQIGQARCEDGYVYVITN